MEQAVIVAARRSPMGRANKGQFLHTRIDDLAAQVVKAALQDVPQLDPKLVEDVLIGCAMPEGEQGLNVARNISFLAGLPLSCGATTVNRYCASSLETINMASASIQTGNGEIFVTGGIESMSHVPMGGFNPSLNEKLMRGEAPAAYIAMGHTAEILAKKYNISREDQDKFALASHQKALSAQEKGKFKREIVTVDAVESQGSIKKVNLDEGPRPDTSLEKLAQLPPAFVEGGTVTAGNSSPLTDGAACVILMAASTAGRLGVKPLAKVRAWAVSGIDPSIMGIAPVEAVQKVLKRAGMRLSDIDLVELNEAFAVQSLAVNRLLAWDMTKFNIHGGAIALGHPLGCSGARIMATLLNALQDQNKSIGLETMCVGGGQGVATIVERL